jgi:hypothetical protein
MLFPVVAEVDGPAVATVAESDLSGDPAEGITIEVWGQSEGTFRCEDPSTAQRTQMFLFYPGFSGATTANGGKCAITITKFPTGVDPRLQGTFDATLMPTWQTTSPAYVVSGSFDIAGVTGFLTVQ